MFQTKKNNTMARSLPITIFILLIAILTGCASSATQAQNQSLSHLPAEIRAREAQRTNLSKHNAQAQRSAMIVPNTGMRPGMSQRAIDAYAARLTEAVNNQPGMSQRAVDAYSLRLTGLAGLQAAMSQRAIDAYAARWTRAVNNQPGMSQRAVDAYSLRLTGLAGLQAAMSNRALAAYSDRLAAEASWYQNR